MEHRSSATLRKIALCVVLVAGLFLQCSQAQLSTTFYSKTCPDVVKTVQQAMKLKFQQTRVAAAGTLRLFFHDCMVEGCDASVILPSTSGNKAEKDADENLSLPGDGFDAVFKAKAAVEAKCPGVVSCADILTLATRDLLVLMGGPSWDVRLGRKDGRVSKASNVAANLPKANMTLDQLTAIFAKKGFTQREMVVLSGGHSAGFAHCNQFMDRIYGKGDPTINPTYAAALRQTCPQQNLDPTVVANLDTTTPFKFDNVFYKNTQSGQGLLRSDQILFTDGRTKKIVNEFAHSGKKFFQEFAAAMDKLSALNVKTGNQGEVRRNCGAVN